MFLFKFKAKNDKNNLWLSIFYFSILYFLFLVGMMIRMYYEQALSIGGTDGVNNYYPFMMYIRRYIRDSIYSFMNGNFSLPLIDYRIGMGDDVIRSFNWVGFGDVFYILVALVPDNAMPWFFTVFFYFRIYLGGVAFCCLANEILKEKSVFAYVTASFLYCFSGFGLESNVHIIFVHAMMYIPLLLCGAERVMCGKKYGKRILIFSLFMFGMSGFFFTYIGVITVAFYTIVRIIVLKKHQDWHDVWKKLFTIIISGLLGIGMSACIFLPAVWGYLASDRNEGIKVSINYLYSVEAYKDMFYTIFMGKELHRSIFSVSIIGIVALIIAVTSKGYKIEKIAVLVCAIGYCVPFFSWIFSGFGEKIYDRWELILILITCLVFINIWNEINRISMKSLLALGVFGGILIILGLYDNMFADRCFQNAFLLYSGCILYFVGMKIVFLISKWDNLFNKLTKIIVDYNEYIFTVLALGGIILTWWTIVDNYPIESVEREQIAEELIDDSSFYRIENEETFMGKTHINLAMSQNYYGTAEYVSIVNPVYLNAVNDEWIIPISSGFLTAGLDRRAGIETLSAVKYFLVRKGHEYLVPYGFNYRNTSVDKGWKLYENEYVLPIGYTYNNFVAYEDYEKASVLEKLSMMMQAVAIEGYKEKDVVGLKTDITMDSCQIIEHYEEKYAKSVYSTGVGKVYKIAVSMKKNCENYLVVNDEYANELIEMRWRDSILQPYMRNSTENLLNLGYASEDEVLYVELLVSSDGNLGINDIQVAHLDMTDYPRYVQKLKTEMLQNVEMSSNKVSGTIEVSDQKMLCMSIPYLEGWSATIDGKETDIYIANSMFMAIEVPSGIHKVEFIYRTPGIEIGCIITLISIFMSVIWYTYSAWLKVRK